MTNQNVQTNRHGPQNKGCNQAIWDIVCRTWEKNPGVRNEMLPQFTEHLLDHVTSEEVCNKQTHMLSG